MSKCGKFPGDLPKTPLGQENLEKIFRGRIGLQLEIWRKLILFFFNFVFLFFFKALPK